MQLALIGLPGSGVRTVFSAISGNTDPGAAAGSSAGGRMAALKVPDQRLDMLAEVFKPRKVVPAIVGLAEYPGLFGSNSARTQAVAKAREASALVPVLRSFQSDVVPHVSGSVDAARDYQLLQDEMILADLAIVEGRLDRLKKGLKKKDNLPELAEQSVLLRIQESLEAGRPVRGLELGVNERKLVRSFGFLSEKPQLPILNIGESQLGDEEALCRPLQEAGFPVEALCASLEAELSQLPESEQAEFMSDFGVRQLAAPRVLSAAYRVLELRTFLTYGEDECRAWNVRIGDTALEAAGRIHTDLAQGFIRAEVIAFDDFREHIEIRKIKAAGKFRLEGREYVVQEGDLIVIRHNA